MDEAHLATAFLYVALNPVRARLIAKAADWRWAGTAAHLADLGDGLVDPRPLLESYARLRRATGRRRGGRSR